MKPAGVKLPRDRAYLAGAFVALLSMTGLAPLLAQSPPVKPPPPPTAEAEEKVPAPVKPVREKVDNRPPPPVLLISSDMATRVELDGEPVLELEKDKVERIQVAPGEHLLQAFPIGVENGPTWKDAIKAPETGTVTAIIELEEIVEDWNAAQIVETVRFEVVEEKIVRDHETGLLWARSVSPAIRWQDAVGYCQKTTTGERTGWRLPELDELSELYWPDHPAPRQETSRGDSRITIFGRRKGEMETLPRLIHEPFDHNSVSALWVQASEDRVACTFLGEFGCSSEGKRTQASVLCVLSPE